MASAVDSAQQGTNITSASTTWNVNVGSPTAGTLLIVLARFAAAPGAITFNGYTQLASDSSDATDDTTAVYYRWADGTEGSTDVLSPTNSVKGCTLCWEILNAENPATSVPTISSVAVGTTTANTANANSVAPAGAPQDTLYLTMAAGDGESSYTGAPSSYGSLVTANSGTTGLPATNCFAGGASQRIANSSSNDAGSFTHGAHTTGWTAYTVAIRGGTGVTTSTTTHSSTTAGKLAARGATTVTFTSSLTDVGKIGWRGQSTVTVTAALDTAGRRTATGSVVVPITWDAVVDGTVTGGGTTLYGETTSTTTFEATTSGKASRYYHPLLDSQDGTWTTHTGGSNLADQLDEHVVDDSDYIRSELRPVDSACRIKLEPGLDPDVDKYHSLNWRIAKSAADGNTVNMQLRLYQGGATTLGGGTLIASFDRTDVSANLTTFHEHLSEAEAAAITNYADLYVELEATVV